METTNEYWINSKTMMLAPALRLEGGTMVYEVDRTFHVKQSPMEIIYENCFRGCATYEGRVQAVRKRFRFQKKVPILIYERLGIAAFPTHSPKHRLCHWVFPAHVRNVEKMPGDKTSVLVHTSNNQVLKLPVTQNVAAKQLGRAYHVLRMLF